MLDQVTREKNRREQKRRESIARRKRMDVSSVEWKHLREQVFERDNRTSFQRCLRKRFKKLC